MLDQGFPHCPIFPTAASRRSLGRVSVPVWLIILSNQLWIVDLVGRYPTNYLIQRGPIQRRNSFPRRAYTVLAVISNCCSVPLGMFPRVTHPSAAISEEIARLACVRPTASVRSEPGSNSQVETSEDVTLTRNDPAHVCVPSSSNNGRNQNPPMVIRVRIF